MTLCKSIMCPGLNGIQMMCGRLTEDTYETIIRSVMMIMMMTRMMMMMAGSTRDHSESGTRSISANPRSSSSRASRTTRATKVFGLVSWSLMIPSFDFLLPRRFRVQRCEFHLQQRNGPAGWTRHSLAAWQRLDQFCLLSGYAMNII